MTKYTVRKQAGSKQFGVFKGTELVEGGFFTRDAAERCAAEWNAAIAAKQ